MADHADIIALTADIVSAHVSNNNVASGDLPNLIQNVFQALSKTSEPVAVEPVKAEPAVSIRSSVKHDYIVCLEDGKKLKMLKRYLRTNYDMTPDEYRAKWGLAKDYPMVAPAYAEQRRGLAVQIGLGRKKGETITKKAPVTKGPAKPRGRPAKGISEAKAAATAHLSGETSAE